MTRHVINTINVTESSWKQIEIYLDCRNIFVETKLDGGWN